MKTISVIEDDIAIRDAIFHSLRNMGYEVNLFPDGEPLLSGDFEMPDLFIIDRQLAGIDGLDLCRHLRAQTATQHIPVLLISASPSANNLYRAAGADAFLEKPFGLRNLRGHVLALLKDE